MKFVRGATIVAAIFLGLSSNAAAQSETRDQVLSQIEAKRAELSLLEKRFLSPSEEDQNTYAEFLAQPNTGLTRLLPREIYDSSDHAEKRMTIRGGGSYFSFTRLTHEYGWGTQIGLQQGEFSGSFAGADFGILANLGEVPLAAMNAGHPAIKLLAAYVPPAYEPDARSEYRRFGDGVVIDGIKYKTRQPAIVNDTYILRGIHYDDSDVLVIFRVVRKDSDGSMTILWKLINQFAKPQLARN